MSQTQQHHVVLGTGPLGSAVQRDLSRRGHRVTMINRSGKRGNLPADVEVVAADLYDSVAVARVTRGAHAVYQCSQPAYHQWPEKFPPLQRAIIDGVAASEARLIAAENLYMLGDVDGQPITEAMPNAAKTRKGSVRGRMSEALFDAHRAGRLRVAAVRGSDFFGPGAAQQATLGERVFGAALAGKPMQTMGPLDVSHTFTYLGDFGRALAEVGSRDDALGEVWNVPNDRPTITQRELGTLIANAAGVAPRFAPLGRPMLILVGLFIPAVREFWEMAYSYAKPLVVDSRKAETRLGLKPTPFAESIAETLAWFRARPAA